MNVALPLRSAYLARIAKGGYALLLPIAVINFGLRCAGDDQKLLPIVRVLQVMYLRVTLRQLCETCAENRYVHSKYPQAPKF